MFDNHTVDVRNFEEVIDMSLELSRHIVDRDHHSSCSSRSLLAHSVSMTNNFSEFSSTIFSFNSTVITYVIQLTLSIYL